MVDQQMQWLARWREGRIGFHRDTPHPWLVEFWPRLALEATARVLVPLCGKSPDMRWLAGAGHEVLGIELSTLALESFIADDDTPVEYDHSDGFERWQQGAITLYGGDFFHFPPQQAGEIGGFHDRAALIALPPPTRQRYALQLAQLLPPGAEGLLITLVHDGGPAKGPPFSVDDDEVQQLLAPNFHCERLAAASADRGEERLWRLVRRGPIS